MYSPELEELIEAIIADGAISEKERSVLHRRATIEGIDTDEIDVVLEGRLAAKNSINSHVNASVKKTEEERINLSSVSSKYGSLRKCPNCGELVKPGTAFCAGCGIEFTNIGAVSSVERLADEIGNIEKRYPVNPEEEKNGISPRATALISIITNFPIPNTKEDLLEFIVFTESKFLHLNNSTDSEVAILKAYKAKYIESVEKAKIYFPDDSQFLNIYSKYEKNRKRKWREMNPAPRFLIIAAISLISFFALIFILIIIAEANNW